MADSFFMLLAWPLDQLARTVLACFLLAGRRATPQYHIPRKV